MATKIMLVEDDTNLSSIYQARLEAEGFQITTAADGEAALALAVKEHPDLIISDVMMPKISGFDMLDILRGTDGIKDTKVIMMTALGQAEDKARADKLGADRYLVKSQVTLEDVVRTVHEVLADQGEPPTAVAQTVAADSRATPVATATPEPLVNSIPVAEPPTATVPVSAPAPAPAAAAPIPVQEPPAAPSADPAGQANNLNPTQASPAPAATSPAPVSTPSAINDDQSTSAEQDNVLSQIEDFINKQEVPAQTSSDTATSVDNAPIANKKIIEPVLDSKPKHSLANLLANEQSTSPSINKSTDGFMPPETSRPAGQPSSSTSALQPDSSPGNHAQNSL